MNADAECFATVIAAQSPSWPQTVSGRQCARATSAHH